MPLHLGQLFGLPNHLQKAAIYLVFTIAIMFMATFQFNSIASHLTLAPYSEPEPPESIDTTSSFEISSPFDITKRLLIVSFFVESILVLSAFRDPSKIQELIDKILNINILSCILLSPVVVIFATSLLMSLAWAGPYFTFTTSFIFLGIHQMGNPLNRQFSQKVGATLLSINAFFSIWLALSYQPIYVTSNLAQSIRSSYYISLFSVNPWSITHISSLGLKADPSISIVIHPAFVSLVFYCISGWILIQSRHKIIQDATVRSWLEKVDISQDFIKSNHSNKSFHDIMEQNPNTSSHLLNRLYYTNKSQITGLVDLILLFLTISVSMYIVGFFFVIFPNSQPFPLPKYLNIFEIIFVAIFLTVLPRWISRTMEKNFGILFSRRFYNIILNTFFGIFFLFIGLTSKLNSPLSFFNSLFIILGQYLFLYAGIYLLFPESYEHFQTVASKLEQRMISELALFSWISNKLDQREDSVSIVSLNVYQVFPRINFQFNIGIISTWNKKFAAYFVPIWLSPSEEIESTDPSTPVFDFVQNHLASYPSFRSRSVLVAPPKSKKSNSLRKVYLHLLKILDNENSKKMMIFLVINFLFMFIELFYGIWCNSLSLTSDAGHMFFDCVSVLIGLNALILAQKPRNNSFTFGYGRFETISGFVNGVFLLFIAGLILLESFERIYSPPDIDTNRLLLVSVAGLVVNIIGVMFFHDHAHGGGGCDHDHGSTNLWGVYLHILADTLGSVAVIISTLLIEYYGWYVADAIGSLFISILIILSSIPLLTSTANVLLQSIPDRHSHTIHQLKSKYPGLTLSLWDHDDSSAFGVFSLQNATSFENSEEIRADIISKFSRVNCSVDISLLEEQPVE